eukprot:TRINITY_DN4655_c0_g1_i3.p2 TRINITY_DN4655_c0_g1~~TRINITY_DN4655_c0_g1_i3.p2  ORF type:complete len:239 (-),score=64.87 TRINITY_DN4655_c0_g1_i3:1039-1755(-)
MLGADIATAEVDGGAPGGCRLVDRHVASVAYPLASTAGGAAAVFPDADDCLDKDPWALVGCAVNTTRARLPSMSTAHSRRPTLPKTGRSSMAPRFSSTPMATGLGSTAAAGGAWRSTCRRRGRVRCGGDLAATGRLPPDANGVTLLTMPNYVVSPNDTDYGCATFSLPPPPPGNATQIVAIEAAIDLTTAGGRLVHHFVLQSCPKTPEFDTYAAGRSCLEQMPLCVDTAGAAPSAPSR